MHTPNDTPSHEEKPEDSIQPDEAATEQSAENTGDEALDPLQALENEATKWREISLRTAAEMDNLRKRTAREREEAIRYANQRLLEELLPVIDNFDMGMQAASQDTSSMIYIGMDMVRRQLGEFLSAQGVEEIGTDGDFDPNLHEAVAQEASPDGSDGRILRVTRKGYKLRERLLRPASVVVSQSSSESAAEGGKA